MEFSKIYDRENFFHFSFWPKLVWKLSKSIESTMIILVGLDMIRCKLIKGNKIQTVRRHWYKKEINPLNRKIPKTGSGVIKVILHCICILRNFRNLLYNSCLKCMMTSCLYNFGINRLRKVPYYSTHWMAGWTMRPRISMASWAQNYPTEFQFG